MSQQKSHPKPTHRRTSRKLRQAQRQRSRRNLRIGSIALIAFAAIIGAYVLVQLLGGNGAALVPNAIPDPTLGAKNAPVVIVEYSDYGCPSCRAWHNAGILEAILANYGDQVEFVWKDFPVISAQSPLAAEAGQCAAAQDKFWLYHDYLYEEATGLGRADLSRYAATVGLDVAAFDECLDTGQMRGKVAENLQSARALRLRAAPSFVVNDQLLPAPPSYEQLAQWIEQAL